MDGNPGGAPVPATAAGAAMGAAGTTVFATAVGAMGAAVLTAGVGAMAVAGAIVTGCVVGAGTKGAATGAEDAALFGTVAEGLVVVVVS